MQTKDPIVDVAAGFIPAKISNGGSLQAGINPAANKAALYPGLIIGRYFRDTTQEKPGPEEEIVIPQYQGRRFHPLKP